LGCNFAPLSWARSQAVFNVCCLQYISPDGIAPVCDDIAMPMSHRDAVISTFVFVHQTLHQANARVAKRGGRTMAITPRHYLDFINHYV
jgi:dynein heavy chain 1